MRFEWDPQKANLRTHGVSLAEAVTVNLLVVVYVYRRPDVIRVISAWKGNKRQREVYEEGRS